MRPPVATKPDRADRWDDPVRLRALPADDPRGGRRGICVGAWPTALDNRAPRRRTERSTAKYGCRRSEIWPPFPASRKVSYRTQRMIEWANIDRPWGHDTGDHQARHGADGNRSRGR